MRIHWMFAVVMVTCVLIGGCDGSPGDQAIHVKGKETEVVQETTFDLAKVVTVDNRSWVPLNLPGDPQDHAQAILSFLKYFEQEKKVEIVDWKIDKQQHAYTVHEKVFGLWIDHRPRQK